MPELLFDADTILTGSLALIGAILAPIVAYSLKKHAAVTIGVVVWLSTCILFLIFLSLHWFKLAASVPVLWYLYSVWDYVTDSKPTRESRRQTTVLMIETSAVVYLFLMVFLLWPILLSVADLLAAMASEIQQLKEVIGENSN